MAQVKGTLWFDTNIQDTALKTAQRIRQQLEQEFAKQIDVKFNVQGLSELGSNSGAAKAKIDELTSSMTSHKSVVAEMTQLYEQLNKQVAQFANNSKIGMNAAQQTNKASRDSVQIERERTSVYARLNSNMKASIGISGQLNDSMAGLYSVYKVKEFLDNVIAIGGQLEQQRVSIAAILHNSAQADDLFERIKGLALQSPFGVLDLDKYTKQLSAYGFQYNELFDMTKRLADISAGAGTDIGRLALALGHVRSATYLTGITLRQFSMNNIPMLKMLADYYSEVEKRIVTTAEVQKRISARDVGYEEVIEVIKRMTDEGGQFYNMQAVMADTLAGKWKNLKDAIDLMYGSIGESWVGGVLKNTASLLTDLTKHWQELGVAMAVAVGVFGSQKVYTAFTNKVIGDHATMVLRDTLAQKQQNAERLRSAAMTRTLTASEMRLLATSEQLTAKDVARLMINKQLTKEEVLRAVAMRKLSVEHTKMAVRLGLLSAAEVKSAASMNIFKRTAQGLQISLGRLGVTLKSLLLNPATLWFAGLTAAVEVFFHYQQQAEKSAERVRHALDTAEEGYKNLSEAASKYKPNLGGTLGQDELNQGVDDMINTIKNYSSQAQNIIRNALYKNPNEPDAEKLQMRSLAEQYNILAQAIQDTTDAYRLMGSVSDVFENANKGTGGTFFWDDSFDKNTKDYIAALNKVSNAETAFMRDRATLNETLEKTGLFKNASKASIDDIKQYLDDLDEGSEQWRKLKASIEQIGGEFTKSFVSFGQAKKGERSSFNDLKADLGKFAETALRDLETRFGKTVENWGQAERYAAQQSLVIHIKSIDGMTDENAKKIEELVYGVWNKTNDFVKNHPFKVDADVERAAKKLNEFQQYLNNLVGKDWVVTLKLNKVGSFEELYDQLDKNVKEGKETMRKLSDGLSESERKMAEAQIVDLSKLTKKQLEYREAYIKTENSRATARKEGFKLAADEKKKNKKTGSGSRGGAKKDSELEAWRLRVDALKAFYAEWNSLRKEMGKTGAYNEIFKSGIMPDMFTPDGKPKYNLDNYAAELGKMNDALAGNTDARKKAKQNLKKEQFKELTQKAKEASDAIIDEFKRATDEIGRQWDNYKSLYEKTGNKAFASLALSDNVLWDEKAKAMAEKLSEEMNVGTISYEMSDEEAKKFFDYNTTRGRSLYEAWKQIVDLIKSNYIKALEDSASAMSNLMSTTDKIAQKEQEIADLRAKGAVENDPRILLKEKEKKELKAKQYEESAEYLRFFSAPLSLAADEAEKAGEKIKEKLVEQLADGTINADKYTKSLKNITQQLEKIRKYKGGFNFFEDGGVKGKLEWNQEISDDILSAASIRVQEAEKELQEVRLKGTWEEIQAAKIRLEYEKKGHQMAQQNADAANQQVESYKKLQNTMSWITAYINMITEAYDAWSNMAESIGEDFDNGNWDYVFEGLKGVSSGVSAAMSGDFGGLASSLASTITGISKRHDKKRDKLIEKAQEQINAINRLRDIMERTLDRTLGGIYQYAQSDEVKKGIGYAANTDRYNEYYDYRDWTYKRYDENANPVKQAAKDALASATYFDTQLALLQQEKAELQKQMAAEDDKKDKDNDKIEDYKASIIELEDRIRNFAIDLAKTIYDIDVKSWAQELGDALVDAWTKGEDAAKAWSEKVKDLISGVTKNIITQKIVETALQPVLDFVVSEMEAKKGRLDEDSAIQLAQKLEEAGNVAIPSVEAFLEAMKQAGYDLSDSASSSASQVLSGLSEDDQGLLMSYINAIRADVSINRSIMERMVVQIETSLPIVGQNIAEHTTLLRSIEANTSRNALSAEVMEGVLTRMERGEFSIRVK